MMTEIEPEVAWTALLPDDVPADYVAAVQSEARAAARHGQVGTIVADLEARLADGAADPSVDPLTLTGPASELAAARAIASVLPPVVPVSQARHNDIAAMLSRPNPAAYRLPSPPQYLGALVHHQRSGHAQTGGELPPQPTELDVEAIKAYERVAAQAAAAWSGLSSFLDDGPRGPMGDFVRAWSDAVNSPAWPALRLAINDLVVLVNAADAARPPSGSCAFGQHSDFRLQPAQPGDPAWTFGWAVKWGIMLVRPPMRDGVLMPVAS